MLQTTRLAVHHDLGMRPSTVWARESDPGMDDISGFRVRVILIHRPRFLFSRARLLGCWGGLMVELSLGLSFIFDATLNGRIGLECLGNNDRRFRIDAAFQFAMRSDNDIPGTTEISSPWILALWERWIFAG